MMKLNLYKQLVFILIAFSFSGNLFAALEPVNTRLQGSDLEDIINGAPLENADNKFYMIQNGTYLGEFENKRVKNSIIFGIDESDLNFNPNLNGAYAYRISFDVEYKKLVSGTLITSYINDVQLDINYDNLLHTKYKDRAVYTFEGGLQVKVFVTKIEEMTGTGWVDINPTTLRSNIYLENEIITERYYDFDQTFLPSPTFTYDNSVTGEITVTWPYIDGAEDYDFEWAWVSGYTGEIVSGLPVIESDLSLLEYNFIENATRVRLNGKNTYTIPLIYGDGYLVFRYRGVGRGGTDYEIPLEGSWSSQNTTGGAIGTLNNYPNFVSVDAHQLNTINYGAGMSFIENGVRSTGVTYMDGVLKPRQSQAQLNSQEKIVVGSTIYDHYGRPAIGVMSTPVNQSYLGYVEELNMHADGTPYCKDHFDLNPTTGDNVGCGQYLAADPMSSVLSQGAANYYSENNTDQEGFNAYLPDAEGYPFVHVQYDNDPTGRIKRVGGVGQDHQIGQLTIGSEVHDAHYTSYDYTTPDDYELYALFGNDGLSSENYTKIITTDVHGQRTAAIVDPLGRTVATYMFGSAPNDLSAIEGNDGNEIVSKNFMPYNDVFPSTGILEVHHTMYIENAGAPYDFHYDFTAGAYTDICIPENLNICFDCVYEVTITIYHDDYNPANPTCRISDGTNLVGDINTGTVSYTYQVGNLTSFDVNCEENPLTFSGVNPTEDYFTLYFPTTGSYSVSKVLTVSQNPINFYWENYVANSTCLLTENDFLEDALGNIDPTDCEDMSPCEFNFLLEYGTEEIFIANGGTAAQYGTLHTDYVANCGALNPCEVMLPMMLNDLSAGGQYGLPADGNTSASDLSVSIFSGSVLYPSGLNFHDYGPFYNEDGSVSYLDLDNNGTLETPAHSATVSSMDFYNNWQDSWAINFLELHPEYCYYEFCNTRADIYEYEQDLNSANTFDEACAAGLLNFVPVLPSNWSTTLPVYPTLCPPTTSGVSVNEDPIFSAFSSSSSSTSLDDDILYTWLITFDITGYSDLNIYEYAVHLSGDDHTSVDFGEGCMKDKHWQMYKLIYMSLRFQIIDLLKEDYVLSNCPNAACVGTTSNPNCSLSPNPFENKVPRHISYNTSFYNLANVGTTNWSTAASTTTAELEEMCDEQCEGMVDVWMDQLSGCASFIPSGQTWNVGQTMYDDLADALVEVCSEGCGSEWPFVAQNNPSGSSTTPPYNSFQSAILDVLGITTETVGCNHLLITHPSPNSGNGIIATYLTGCACEALLDENATTAEEFLAIYGFLPVDYEAEKCQCEAYENGGDWSALEAAEIITVNDYNCGADCLSCLTLTATGGLIDQFETEFSVTYTDYPALFTAFVNENSPHAYSFQEITDLIENCEALNASTTTPIYNLLNQETFDFVNLLNDLADDNLSTSYNDYNHLTLDGYFYSGLFTCTNTTTATYDYTPTLSGNDISFNIDNSDCTGNCAVDLDLISTLPGSFSSASQMYGNILSFGLPYILNDDYILLTTSSPNMNFFYVDATVTNPAGGTVSLTFKVTSPCHTFITLYEEGAPTRIPSFRICGEEETVSGNPCMENLIANAEQNAHEMYNEYLHAQFAIFKANYISQCTQVQEVFDVEYESNRYHYTLLYYDLSGNLTKTVPPMGVHILNSTDVAMVLAHVSNPTVQPTPIYPNHQFVTTYKHNALNQVVEVNTPDGGTSKYWYDELGRLVVSQNAKQAEFNTGIITGDVSESGLDIPAYSYTIYDELGRVIEVGEIIHPQAMTNTISKDPHALSDWLSETSVLIGMSSWPVYKNNITQMYYDTKFSTDAETEFGVLGYGETRNRITAASVISGYVSPTGTDWIYPYPDYVNHYQYDVHGNVSSFIQEIDNLTDFDHPYFKVDYEYDLISGNPNYIYFQKDKPDQFIHHYTYDADNRLAEVFTSNNGIIWDRDADYEYREDGYLARTEIGEMKVQGMDYAYTLHGWIKTLNSGVLNADRDMGHDGASTGSATQYDNYENEIHGLMARDVLAYSVGYYTGDYKAISRNQTGFQNMSANVNSSSGFATDKIDLYNGNITSLITNMTDCDGNLLDVLGYTYHYDQLHRFKLMHVFSTDATTANTDNGVNGATRKNVGVSITGLGDYEMALSYDQNGNITNLTRMGYGATDNKMDQFIYYNLREDGVTNYNASAGNPINFASPGQGYTNRLDYVDDAAGNTSNYDDIEDNQATGNYSYYANGTLKSDADENIKYIDWYPSGLIKRIYRNGTNGLSDLYYEYNPLGQRVLQVEITRDQSTYEIKPSDEWKYTYYTYDANGINMSIYSVDLLPTVDEIKRIEAVIYGSSRIGTENTEIDITPRINETYCNEGCIQTVIVEIKNPLPYGNPDILINIDGTPIHTAITFTSDYPATAQNLAAAINTANTNLLAYVVNAGIGVYQVLIEELEPGALCGEITLTLDAVDATETYLYRLPLNNQCFAERVLGNKLFEISNYLGNVNEVISDRKIAIGTSAFSHFEADVMRYTDYYPYGMEMPGRNGFQSTGGDYRFAYNGMESDPEVSGNGNSYTTQFRQYDPRLGRWKSLDPLAGKYPSQSPYCAFNNNPIYFVDPKGLEGIEPKGDGTKDNPYQVTSHREGYKILDDINPKPGQVVYFTNGKTTVKATYNNGQWETKWGPAKADESKWQSGNPHPGKSSGQNTNTNTSSTSTNQTTKTTQTSVNTEKFDTGLGSDRLVNVSSTPVDNSKPKSVGVLGNTYSGTIGSLASVSWSGTWLFVYGDGSLYSGHFILIGTRSSGFRLTGVGAEVGTGFAVGRLYTIDGPMTNFESLIEENTSNVDVLSVGLPYDLISIDWITETCYDASGNLIYRFDAGGLSLGLSANPLPMTISFMESEATSVFIWPPLTNDDTLRVNSDQELFNWLNSRTILTNP